MSIDCLVLGAGQEVGKSCVLVSINGKRIMFDCGMHMGHDDDRRYPNFSLISESGDFDSAIDCIIITHFHLDHIGALPYFTQVCGYSGPIYMTYPTKALGPLMLEDFRKVMVQRRGVEEQFTVDHISECMKKVTPVDLKQTIQVDKDLQIRAYYAGHVLGAAMFYAKVGDASMVYTGDYNMTPDRHLGAAQIDQLEVDLVITESTYATTVRDSKYAREREFLKAVHTCVADGGKVLIPTFALGRAQELCILLDDYWERMNLKVPIYFSSVVSFDRSKINAPGPCVLFATPGMISGGLSLEVFKQWAPSEFNLVMLAGYCVTGTIGSKLVDGKQKKIYVDKDSQIDVRCKVHQLSFSPHTDSKGIMDLLKFLSPKHVMLVHGEKPGMVTLQAKVESELRIPCYMPANCETVHIPTTTLDKAHTSDTFAKSCLSPNFSFSRCSSNDECSRSGPESRNLSSSLLVSDDRVCEGILVRDANNSKAIHQDEVAEMLGEKQKAMV
ncbi:Cleavage and polyadenylation specificity factor subunit 3-II [Linum grandiflorum]